MKEKLYLKIEQMSDSEKREFVKNVKEHIELQHPIHISYLTFLIASLVITLNSIVFNKDFIFPNLLSKILIVLYIISSSISALFFFRWHSRLIGLKMELLKYFITLDIKDLVDTHIFNGYWIYKRKNYLVIHYTFLVSICIAILFVLNHVYHKH